MSDFVGELINIIQNVGFPIACCCVMFYQNMKLKDTIEQMTTKFTDALSQNTEMLKEIYNKVDKND